ncbi:rifin [Plasmodium falciparum IGH-CR14]|uniref:Rifin n=1 Tax=Plasmodium falciparum IGH-CR14 TaxID=580059 RepID=A0A0L1I9L1_PLAFA|nr:rifin [Plasmodium falciparum IGH-CR14]
MKVHYINILLFALPLNIFVTLCHDHIKNKLSIITRHIPTTRLLCECDLYMPNYDNDPQIKELMDNFNKQTQQRLREYDDRMVEKRKLCKEQCDKEIQKIILKDKIEKELTENFATLQTDIRSDAIPTCVCEKSVADKVEKGCLRCGYGLGTVAPTVGLIGAVAVHAWKPLALKAAIAAALKANDATIASAAQAAGKIAGEAKGVDVVISALEQLGIKKLCPELLKSIGTTTHYTEVLKIANAIIGKYEANCAWNITSATRAMCTDVGTKFKLIRNETMDFLPTRPGITRKVYDIVDNATSSAQRAAGDKVAEVTAAKKLVIETAQEKAIEAASTHLYTTIAYSILAILIIVLIMVIIYLILRYRRKKKMKKKLQYIKLLEE